MSNICTCPNQTGLNVNKTTEEGKVTCFVCNGEVEFTPKIEQYLIKRHEKVITERMFSSYGGESRPII